MSALLDVKWESAVGLSVSVDGGTVMEHGGPVLYWRPVGETSWRRSPATVSVKSSSPDRIELDCVLDVVRMELLAARVDERTWEFSGRFRNSSSEAIELSRLHYAEGLLLRAFDLLAPTDNRRFTPNSDVASFVERNERMWSAMKVTWPRLKDPIHVETNWGIGTDTAVLMGDWLRPALFCGFTGPGSAFGEMGMRTKGERRLYFGARLDNVVLASGASRPLETCVLVWGDAQDSLRYWAKRCTQDTAGRPVRAPIVGWCSWYQHYAGVKADDVRRAAKEFASWPIPPGGRTVQIDDGFQIMPGDWRPNERFQACWDALPGEIAATGSIPGLWLAPTTVFCRHPIVAEHPEWLQRMPDGKLAVSFSNWAWCARKDGEKGETNLPTYHLDPDHPDARRFMFEIVRSAVVAGWKYLKLDFTYALSTARAARDRSKTAMETQRDLYKLFREAAGPDAVLCACADPDRWALGYADTARLGGDIGDNWHTVRKNLPEFLVRLSTNGLWWNGDPDVFYMRSERSHLTPEESWLLTGTIGLMGGVFLTSDFASQWDAEAKRRIGYFWNEKGPVLPAEQRCLFLPDGTVQALCVTRADGEGWRVGLYNWSDDAATIRVSLDVLRLPASAQVQGSFPEAPAGRLDHGALVCENQPPHSLRIVELSSGDA
jgi:hypothetical protein